MNEYISVDKIGCLPPLIAGTYGVPAALSSMFSVVSGLPTHELILLPSSEITNQYLKKELGAISDEVECNNIELKFRSCSSVLHCQPRVRNHFSRSTPVILFDLGEAIMGGLVYWKNAKDFYSNDYIVVSSRADYEVAQRLFLQPRPNIEYIPFAVDTNLWNYDVQSPEQRQVIADQYGFPARNRILIYTGRLTLQKNIHVLLLMLAEIKKSRKDVSLLLCGSFDDHRYQDYIEEMAQKLQISDDVYFLGYCPSWEVRKLLSIADVFVNATVNRDENFGYSQVEAMACQLPVVCTDWGGLKDTVVHGYTGYRFPSLITKNGIQVAWKTGTRYILRLLTDEDKRRALGQASREWVEKRFAFRAVAKQFDKLLFKQKHKEGAKMMVLRFNPEIGRYYIRARMSINAAGFLDWQRLIENEFSIFLLLAEPYATRLVDNAQPLALLPTTSLYEGNTAILSLDRLPSKSSCQSLESDFDQNERLIFAFLPETAGFIYQKITEKAKLSWEEFCRTVNRMEAMGLILREEDEISYPASASESDLPVIVTEERPIEGNNR